MRYGTRKEYETFLHKVMKESPHKDVQGIACLSLAQFLNSHSLKFDLLQDRPELSGQYEALLGKGYYEELRRKGRDGRIKEVEALLEQAEAKYGEVKMPWGGPVGEQAKAELFSIRHLGVGKQAEDIDGKDQDGKPFKLSQYRGKPSNLHCRRTLNSAWPASISARRASAEGGSFFFEPFQLHLEPPDLLVQLPLHSLGVGAGGLGAVSEDTLRSSHQLLFPTVDQRRMHVKLAGQLVDRAILLQSRQRHLGLEPSLILLTLPCHALSPFPGSPV
jgi:hypothetical protein